MTTTSSSGAPRPLGRSGLSVPPLSLGGAGLGNLHERISERGASELVEEAWRRGVRYFDTAPLYGLGMSERRLGAALAAHDRDDYVLSTKAGRLLVPREDADPSALQPGFLVPDDHRIVRDYTRSGVLRSIDESLERLRTDRVDVVLVHDPDDVPELVLDQSLPALEELRAQGVIRSYGVGMNHTALPTRFVRESDLDVVLIAGRLTLLDHSAIDDLVVAAAEQDVSIVAGGVFNSGVLATPLPGDGARYAYEPAPADVLARAREIARIVAEHGLTLPEAAAQFPLLAPVTRTIVLGADSAAQVAENARLLDRPAPPDLWRELITEGHIDERVAAWLGNEA